MSQISLKVKARALFTDVTAVQNDRKGKYHIWRMCTYRSLISMNMAGKDNIDFVLHKPGLIHYSHGFPFHVMIYITVIHWRMHKNNKPWCLSPVYFRQLVF